MKFSDLLGMSVGNLLRRKVRTLLTILGVLIGTASVVTMVSIGIGFKFHASGKLRGDEDDKYTVKGLL